MKKFKHRITGKTCTEKDTFYYIDSEGNLPKWVVEGSTDWVEITDIPKYVKLILNSVWGVPKGTVCRVVKENVYNRNQWVLENTIVKNSQRNPENNNWFFVLKEYCIPATQREYEAQLTPVLFITEDGVGIRKGHTSWRVLEADNFRLLHHANIAYPDKGVKYFSTKESAQEYIDSNKLVYTKKQAIQMLRAFDKAITDYDEGGDEGYIEFLL